MNPVFDERSKRHRNEETFDAQAAWDLVRRNRVLILGCLLLACAGSVLFITLATPIYEARTSIRIEDQTSTSSVANMMRDAASAQKLTGGSRVATEMEVLRSRTLAEAVVDSLNLNLVVNAPRGVARETLFAGLDVSAAAPKARYLLKRDEDGGAFVVFDEQGERLKQVLPGRRLALPGVVLTLAPDAIRHDEIRLTVREFLDTVDHLQASLDVARPNADANIVEIRYEGARPRLVESIANLVAQLFIQRQQRVQKTEARSTVAFLTAQIRSIADQLSAAEDTLASFRETHHVINLEAEATAQVSRMTELRSQRDAITAEKNALANLLREVQAAADRPAGFRERSPYRRLLAFPSLLRNEAAMQLMSSLTTIENERVRLLNRRTRKDPDVQVLTRRIHELEDQIRSVATTYLQGLREQEAALDTTLRRFGVQVERIPEREIRYARLRRQTELLEEIHTLLQRRLKEAQIAQAVEDPSVRVVDPAIMPRDPIKPNKPVIVVLAVLVGIMLGLGSAFTKERLDTALHTREDLEDTTGVPVLGLTPRIGEAPDPEQDLTLAGLPVFRIIPQIWKSNDDAPGEDGAVSAPPADVVAEARFITGYDPANPVSEAYRSLRTNLTFANPEDPPKTLVFTSATPADGKTTTATNLAITLSQQGLRCVLIDADLRRGSINESFGIARSPGLSNILLGATSIKDGLHEIDVGRGENLTLLPTGTRPPNPAELLGSNRLETLLDTLEDTYDVLIVDTPPVNLVTDAALLGTKSDGVILVARAGITHREAIGYAVQQLKNARAPLLGAVLNDISRPNEHRYFSSRRGRYYGYYYSAAQEQSAA